MEELYVFRNNADRVLVGKLVCYEAGYRFSYDPHYVLNGDAEALHPFLLRLTDKLTLFKEGMLEGVLTIFKDALPGGWGRAIMENVMGKSLTDMECLIGDQFDRVGDLVFSRTKQFPEMAPNVSFDWEELFEAKDRIERHELLSEKQKSLLKQGSGQGGARPKISLVKNDIHYLVKLPSLNDRHLNMPQIEHGTLCLAKSCGLNVVQSELLTIGERDVLLVKRFDRNGQHGIPYMSLASVCGFRSHDQPSYLAFASELPRFGATSDLEELFKRMVFNILISNRDDHQLNHGVLKLNSRWRLSPAFDVVAGEGRSKLQCMIVGAQNRAPTLENALSSCENFKITKSKAKELIDGMANFIQANWKKVFSENGVSEEMICEINWAIMHHDVFKCKS